MSVKIKINNFTNKAIRRFSPWFNDSLFPECRKFWIHHTYDMDVVNTGTSSALYAFDYSNFNNLKAANWAMSHQSLLFDFEVLKNYYSYLKKDTVILISLSPVSCFSDYNCYAADHYYTILSHHSLPGFHVKRLFNIEDKRKNPIKYYPLSALFPDIWKGLGFGRKVKTLSDRELELDAKWRLSSWMKELSIKDFNRPLSLKNRDSFKESVEILSTYINYCLSRELKPVIVIPPVHRSLAALFSDDIRRMWIDDYVKQANVPKIPVYNYFDSHFSSDSSLFRNSFCLNKKGAILFTESVLKECDFECSYS